MNRLMSAVTQGKALGLHDAGWSLSWIGKHLGVTKGAVSRICAKRSAELGSGNFLEIVPKPGEIDAMAVIKNTGYSTKYLKREAARTEDGRFVFVFVSMEAQLPFVTIYVNIY